MSGSRIARLARSSVTFSIFRSRITATWSTSRSRSASSTRARFASPPSTGVAVTLTSFDLAGWPQFDYTADVIQVVDANNTVLWTAPDLTVLGAGPTHSAFSVNVTSSIPIYLRFGNTYNIGIDNIRFSQAPVSAPEPGSLVLLALGGAALGLARKKKRTVMAR